MRILAADTLAIRRVALHMRERDFLELSAVLPFQNRQQLADYFTEAYYGRGDIQAVYDRDGNAVAIVGALLPRPGVLSLLMFATPEVCAVHLSLTRWLRKSWLPAMREAGVHRIDAISLDGYSRMHRWLEAIGLRRESVMTKFGRGGQDFVMFAWTAA
jgi:hypothetical protein